jgi:uncharacterized protein (DUF1697 family)
VPTYVAFLRGINLGGHTVKNTQLVKIFAGAGFPGAEPFIASGNVIFDAKSGSETALTRKLEGALAKTLGYEVRIFLRTLDELEAISALEPFTPARRKSAFVLVVGFLEAAATAAQKKIIAGFANGESDFHVKGREVYWLCQVGQSQSAFFRVPFEKRIGGACSWRNLNTVQRILKKYGA